MKKNKKRKSRIRLMLYILIVVEEELFVEKKCLETAIPFQSNRTPVSI